MTVKQRVELAAEYHKWLSEKSKDQFKIADQPENFLVFLETKGLLREISSVCELMNAELDCDDYERKANFTCCLSSFCDSCIHNKYIKEIDHD